MEQVDYNRFLALTSTCLKSVCLINLCSQFLEQLNLSIWPFFMKNKNNILLFNKCISEKTKERGSLNFCIASIFLDRLTNEFRPAYIGQLNIIKNVSDILGKLHFLTFSLCYMLWSLWLNYLKRGRKIWFAIETKEQVISKIDFEHFEKFEKNLLNSLVD